MIDPAEAFSSSYAEARGKFLEAAAAAGMSIESHIHPERGRDGEELALDVALQGADDARSVLFISSACHGVEGYCGSGVQVHALADESWRAAAQAAGVAVVYLHALNPYGFSHLRRVTHENVDLNRNFQDFTRPLPPNPAYAEVHALLLPQVWPPQADNIAGIQAYLAERGTAAFQAAVSRGQYEFPDGLFYGGQAPTWSHRRVREILRQHGGRAERIAWIDLHTGLGPNGHGERIAASREDDETLARARRWWGGEGRTPVTAMRDGSTVSAPLTGMMWHAIYEECPQAEYTGIAIEYGTQPLLQVLEALRAEHWLHLHPEAPAALRHTIKRQVLEAFYTDTDVWKRSIVEQARSAMQQAVVGLTTVH